MNNEAITEQVFDQTPPPIPNQISIVTEQLFFHKLLKDNELYFEIAGDIDSSYFIDPFHVELFTAMCNEIKAGRKANPYTLIELFADFSDENFRPSSYIVKLVTLDCGANTFKETVERLKDLKIRRDLKVIGEEISFNASAHACEIQTDEIIETAEAKLYSQGGHKIKQDWQTLGAATKETLDMAADAMSNDSNIAGLSTGIKAADKLLGGLQRGNLLLLAARPSMGKTALGLNIAYNVARTGAPVAFFSMEMSAEELSTRIISSVVKITGENIRRGNMNVNDFTRVTDAAARTAETPLFIDDSGGLTIGQIIARARRLHRRQGIKLIVLDYIQLAHGDNRRRDNRVLEIGEISMGLKTLAKELKIPIIALSQLSRDLERRPDKRPELADLRDSGTLEQDADVVLFLYREEYYLARKEPAPGDIEKAAKWNDRMEKAAGVAELIAAKQRHGPTGTAKLHFDGKHTLFVDPSKAKVFGSW